MEVPVTPMNGQTNVELQSTLRWPSYPKAIRYVIYVWLYGQEKPEQPNRTEWRNTYWTTPTLLSNTKYSWQVEIDIGKNETIPSPKWSFETRKIADLTVETVVVQRVAFSGQSFVVQWTVRNIGSGITDISSWNDVVYYSFTDSLLDAKRLKQFTYVTLQNSNVGLLWIFVETGYHDYNKTNNERASDHRVDVKLTPPPDLQVDSIIIPGGTYSGTPLDVIYTVRNHGDGATIVDSWKDDIYWSKDNIYARYSPKRNFRNGKLVPDESYTVHLSVLVPRNIYGNYTIIVHSDSGNYVYEHGMDENNKNASKIIDVTLTPPPDLRIQELLTDKTFFVTGDTMVIQWTVINDGHKSPYALYWRDDVKLNSLDHSGRYFNIGQQSYNAKLNPYMSYNRSLTYTIPANILSGTYNVSVMTDYNNQVFEFHKEDNNVLSKEIKIKKSLSDLFEVISEAVFSGNPLELECLVGNRGAAIKSDQRWYRNIIISTTRSQYTNIVSQKSVQIGPLHTEHFSRTTSSLLIPKSVHGEVYLHCIVETNNIFEGREPSRLENNHKVITLFINRPPSPDLLVSAFKVSLKNSSSSQTLVSVTWSVQNTGNSMPFRSNWLDAVGISKQNHVHLSEMARHVEILNTFELLYGLEPSASTLCRKQLLFQKVYRNILHICYH
ncbi:unnamed protein product [Mytilus edulis]|uniref:CARDB domain-containing protein n=1 Tax=Mytilus edulis TaxID=6550 RepID=A0A8S3Q6W0_MYTED|nr:unnamed protein product [Mytilus edulis]